MNWQAEVFIQLRESIVDPAGETVLKAVHELGYEQVRHVHIGKYITLELEAADEDEARRRAEAICEKLLVNPVMENYELRIQPSESKAGQG